MLIHNEEVFFIPYHQNKNDYILYAPLRSKLFLVSRKVYENIKARHLAFFRESILPKLQRSKLIKVEDIMNALLDMPPELAMAITNRCTLKCPYCHANANSPGKSNTMKWPLLKKMIDLYFSKLRGGQKELPVSFARGGEPTVTPRLMDRTIKYINKLAKEKNTATKYSMATNAYYLNDKIARYIENNFSDISISLDGPEFIQSKQRPPIKPNRNYFKIIMRNAKYLFASGKINVAFRATISDWSLKHLTEVLDFFIKEFPGCTLGLEPMNPFGRGRSCKVIKPPNKLKFARALEKAIDYAGEKVYIVNASIGNFDTIRVFFCTAVATIAWNITPDGKLWCCTRDNAPEYFCYGKFDEKKNEIVFDERKINKIRSLNVSNFKECEDCFLKYNCAGDCPDLRAVNLINCYANRMLGAKYLNQIISKKGGYYESCCRQR